MAKEIAAGIIIYRKTKDGLKFLLLYHGGGYWNFPKGKLENEEKSFKAALREIKEETGLDSYDLKFKQRFRVTDKYTFQRNGEKILKIITYYLAETSKLEVVISREHEGYGWFLYRNAKKVLKFKGVRERLSQANDAIQGKGL